MVIHSIVLPALKY